MGYVGYSGKNNCLSFMGFDFNNASSADFICSYDCVNGSFLEFVYNYSGSLIIHLSLMSEYKIKKSGIMLNDEILCESENNICIFDSKDYSFRQGDKLRFFADGISSIKDCEIKIWSE